MGGMGVLDASYLQHLAASHAPLALPPKPVSTGVFSFDDIGRYSEQLSVTIEPWRLGSAVALIEQCVHAYEESAYRTPSISPDDLVTSVKTIAWKLRDGTSNIQPHADRVDELLTRLRRADRHCALRKNQLYEMRGSQGELDIFGICVENDDVLSYEYHELKTCGKQKHHDHGVEQIHAWMQSMHKDFDIPYSRLRGYVWLPSPKAQGGQHHYVPELVMLQQYH